jgi:hypothetical protein
MTKALVQQEKATTSQKLESDAALCRSSFSQLNHFKDLMKLCSSSKAYSDMPQAD